MKTNPISGKSVDDTETSDSNSGAITRSIDFQNIQNKIHFLNKTFGFGSVHFPGGQQK